jgi:hypothetical protein
MIHSPFAFLAGTGDRVKVEKMFAERERLYQHNLQRLGDIDRLKEKNEILSEEVKMKEELIPGMEKMIAHIKKLAEENKDLKEEKEELQSQLEDDTRQVHLLFAENEKLKADLKLSEDKVCELTHENMEFYGIQEENEKLQIPDGVKSCFKSLNSAWYDDESRFYSENYDEQMEGKYEEPEDIPTKHLQDCNYRDLRVVWEWLIDGKYEEYEEEEETEEESEEEEEETEEE